MTTEEIEALYLKHAEDFGYLLGAAGAGGELAYFHGGVVLTCVETVSRETCWAHRRREWHVFFNCGKSIIAAPFAVAAMTECWRERLEEEYGAIIGRTGDGNWRADRGFWGVTSRFSVKVPTCRTLPELICAVVKVLAGEKRKAEKPKPSAAAMRAAGRAIGALQTNGILVGPWIETTAAIIDEEFNRETNP